MNIFEMATRKKIRFNSPQGDLSTEDLWDLPLSSKVNGKANLDDIAKDLHRLLFGELPLRHRAKRRLGI